jgi:tight adherence protein B
MFLIGFVFVIVLLLSFGVVLLMTRPTKAERVIEGRIAKLSGSQIGAAGLRDEAAEIIKPTRLSELPWLDAALQDFRPAQSLQLLIAQARSPWSVGGVLGGSVMLAVAGYGLGCYQFGAMIAVLPAIVSGVSPLLVLRFQRVRRLREFNRHLPEAIDLMSRALRAGHSVQAAIEIIGEEAPEPVRTEFREVYRQQNFGLPAREALVQLAQRVPLPELNFVVTAMLLQKETGGNLVEVLDRTTAVIRERLRIQGEIRIYTAQGRMTGWILSLLPVVMFFLISFTNRGYTSVLLEDPTGRKLVLGGLALMAVGGFAIRNIVNVKV